jgi:4-amino-4-deoxy-L-arabinose transferase-like glycosyltransferase
VTRRTHTFIFLYRFAAEHPLWLVYLIAVGARVLNLIQISYSGGEFMIEDSGLYPVIAQDWMKSLGLIPGEPRPIGYEERAPLYPVFVGAMQLLHLGKPIYLVLANTIFDAGTCVLIAKLGCMLDRRTGLAAGLLAGLWPNLIIHSGLVLTDTLFVLFMTGTIVSFARFAVEPSIKHAAVTGFLLGLAILTRPIAQFLPIPVFIVLLMAARANSCSWRRSISASLVQLIAVTAVVLPTLMHNKERFDSLSLTSQTGVHLLFWIVPAVHEAEYGTSKAKTSEQMRDKLTAQLKESGLQPHQIKGFDLSRVQTRLALDILADSSPSAIAEAWLNGFALNLATPAILADPRIRSLSNQSFYNIEATGIFGKIRRYVGGNGALYGFIFAVCSIGSLVTLIASCLGFWTLTRRNKVVAALVFAILLYFLSITGPVASPKYRLPFEPLLILLTVIGTFPLIETICDRIRSRKERRATT